MLYIHIMIHPQHTPRLFPRGPLVLNRAIDIIILWVQHPNANPTVMREMVFINTPESGVEMGTRMVGGF
jgi:hypothetical protein